MSEKVLFIDRDGTLIEEPADNQLDRLDKVKLVTGVIPALLRLAGHGYRFVMVSNQDGLGTESFPKNDFDVCHNHVLSLFESQGIVFDEVFICPHAPDAGCTCRKPATGLLTAYLMRTNLDVAASAVIGDRESDRQFAENIGTRGLQISNGVSWSAIADALCVSSRQSQVERKTRETSIRAVVNLDADNPITIHSGIGFYDHMLEQIAKHGGFSLLLECDGDLDVDEHHTVEDTAICIGDALRKALGDKRGIGRYGFLLPMDESEAKVSLDLSGRAFFVFDGEFNRDKVGGLPTELVPHFFHSLADSLGAALHISVTGDNAHHMVEACFKSVGRALRQAIRREGDGIPSTKGIPSRHVT
ncbi:MAG: bifunctional histidinol-phosphatase/imidazoleglycerol-phosphate dehydratase HisB [Proteobacteria bacterium]|nr:bifunctional histidinol-phosphatase/imidazoleglycerol-phosphate dehydratase HisB [Pseudomonadota bacterium]